MKRTLATLAALLVIAAVLAPAASANHGVVGTVAGPSAPVHRGEDVTYTITVTNNRSPVEPDPDRWWVEEDAIEQDARMRTSMRQNRQVSDHDWPSSNKFRSVSTSRGSCRIELEHPRYDWEYVLCEFGDLPPGASVRVTIVLEAKESVNFCIRGTNAGGGIGGTRIHPPDDDRGLPCTTTTVIYRPALKGSRKIKLRGLPAWCARQNFAARARVRDPKVKRLVVQFGDPRDEYGLSLGSEWFVKGGMRKLANVKARRVRVKIPVARIQANPELQRRGIFPFYKLKVVAYRDGAKKLEREARLQICL